MAGIKYRKHGTPNRDLRKRGVRLPFAQELPLVHVTRVGAALEVIDAGQIEARFCKVFKTSLAYFFVLRPAFRIEDSDKKSKQIERFPFVFIVDPANLGPPRHVYPLDTGAAFSGVFGDRPSPNVYLEDYELAPDLASAKAHIGWAFGSLRDYFEGNLRVDLEANLEPWNFVENSYATIARMASSDYNRPDKRASAIEVAYDHHIQLHGNPVFAILPKQLLETATGRNGALIRLLRNRRVSYQAYDWQPNSTPDDFFAEITAIAFRYLKTKVPL